MPDDPSIKVFSKKKAAGRTQHSLRSFSVPLRSAEGASASARAFGGDGGADNNGAGKGSGATVGAGAGSGVADGAVNISVPGNLPADADEVVERMKRSLRAFKQVC